MSVFERVEICEYNTTPLFIPIGITTLYTIYYIL